MGIEDYYNIGVRDFTIKVKYTDEFVLTNDAGDTIETLDNVLNFFNGKVINLNIVMSGSFSEKALSYLTGLIMQNAKFILTTNNYDYYNYFPKNKNFYFM